VANTADPECRESDVGSICSIRRLRCNELPRGSESPGTCSHPTLRRELGIILHSLYCPPSHGWYNPVSNPRHYGVKPLTRKHRLADICEILGYGPLHLSAVWPISTNFKVSIDCLFASHATQPVPIMQSLPLPNLDEQEPSGSQSTGALPAAAPPLDNLPQGRW
jgi:hypothetical protein